MTMSTLFPESESGRFYDRASCAEHRVSGVLIDLDDTIYPQSAYLSGAWDAVAEAGGRFGLDESRLRDALGDVSHEGSDRGGIVDRALLAVGVPIAVLPRYVPLLVAAFRGYSPSVLVPYPGVLEALFAVRARVPVAIVTDGDPRVQRTKIATLGLAARVDAIVISDELGGRSARKPSPVALEHALSLIGVDVAEAVMIGDRPDKDVLASARLGMRSIRVRTGEYATLPDAVAAPELVPPGGLASGGLTSGGLACPWRTAPDATTALQDLAPLLP